MQIQSFTFGPFQENTFILFDETNEAVIIDPGCFSSDEKKELQDFIQHNKLQIKLLLNTHCHLDHIAGNAFIHDVFGLLPIIHKDDLPILDNQERSCAMYGILCEVSPRPVEFIEEGEQIKFGNQILDVIHVPGHAPGHVVFYNKAHESVINGDVLFNGSIGRTDLPLGNHEQLIQNIKSKMYKLPDETVVYCGHGPATTIGNEKRSNPFVRG